jgi:hypothetical protein
MKKIESVIERCNDCRFYKKYIRPNGEKEFAYICILKPQLLVLTDSKDDFIQDFSPNCPLETYK